jgi:SAM-dependent methyltransferase
MRAEGYTCCPEVPGPTTRLVRHPRLLAILRPVLRLFRRHTPEPPPPNGELPIPPLAMRELVGPREPEAFDHPRGQPLFPTLTRPEQYDFVLDFGCGCGRVARRLAVADAPMPKRYVGIDLHAGMIDWANKNLAPRLPGFTFVHQDVFNPGFNPDPSLPRTARFPAKDNSVSLLLALSVFTHLVQSQAERYLDEVRRVLRPDGVMLATFFLFDKAHFPMMQDFQNALYINDSDPTNAVIFDRAWLLAALDMRDLRIRDVRPPSVRGYHWELEIAPGRGSVELPEDAAEFGREPPPVCSKPAYMIGETSTVRQRLDRRRHA